MHRQLDWKVSRARVLNSLSYSDIYDIYFVRITSFMKKLNEIIVLSPRSAQGHVMKATSYPRGWFSFILSAQLSFIPTSHILNPFKRESQLCSSQLASRCTSVQIKCFMSLRPGYAYRCRIQIIYMAHCPQRYMRSPTRVGGICRCYNCRHVVNQASLRTVMKILQTKEVRGPVKDRKKFRLAK